MKPVLQFLSTDEVRQLHEASLAILATTGFRFQSAAARDLLVQAGAKHVGSDVVQFPRGLVEQALARTPKRAEVTLYGRDPQHDVRFDGRRPSLATMTMAVAVLDPDTGDKRPATAHDLAALTRILHQLDHVSIAGGLVTPQDVPSATSDWHTWAITLQNTSKHITGGFASPAGVRDALAMAAIAADSEQRVRERPFISGWVFPMSPLTLDRDSCEVTLEMSRQGVAAILSSGPVIGSSSPVTLAGTIAQAHAEILACLVLIQTANPGTPVVYTSIARGIDMRTGGISMACPEFGILKAAMAQMGRFVDLPVRMPSMLRDAKLLDAQAGFETGMVATLAAFGADIMDGMQLDMNLVVDYADPVFCDECMQAVQRAVRDLVVNETTLALDAIDKVGHGGTFLMDLHTLTHFKQELWQPKLLERGNWEAWQQRGGRDVISVARQRALQMAEDPSPTLLSAEQRGAITEIADAASVG